MKKEGSRPRSSSSERATLAPSRYSHTPNSEFDAKPRDLSRNAMNWELVDRSSTSISRIFTKQSFTKLNLNSRLVSVLEKPSDAGGFALDTCTTVQSLTIPVAVERKQNLLLKSQTGSGKTLAYLVPVINDLMTMQPEIERNDGTMALVIVPTRELSNQIADVLAKLTKCCVKVVGGSISGGEKKKSEKARLRKGVVILVGTPGRLLDHVRSTESFNLTKLRWIVLDEIDRLLDMGFEQTILEVLSRIRGEKLPGLKEAASNNIDYASKNDAGKNLSKRWNEKNAVFVKKCANPLDLRYIMASATLTSAVKQLAWPIMGSFSKVGFSVVDGDNGTTTSIATETELATFNEKPAPKSTGTISFMDENEDADKAEINEKDSKMRTTLSEGEMVGAPSRLAQYYMLVTCKWRLAALLSFLHLRRNQKVIVFFSTCDSVDYHSLLLNTMTWPTELDKDNDEGAKQSVDVAVAEQPNLASATKKPVSKSIDPLEWKFFGIFGETCPMFRLHGKVPQHTRKMVYKEFCATKSGILLCTDVAARGLDLPHVDWILQYDPPCETTDYVHRIGRTARKGLSGSALTLLLPSESMYIQLLSTHGLLPSPLSSQSMLLEASKSIPGAKKFKNMDEMCAVILQRRAENVVAANKYMTEAGVQAFRSYVRAYATHSVDTKGIFRVQSLHLGHVAKSFALKENPKELKNMSAQVSDVIGRIFNGEFANKATLKSRAKAAAEEAERKRQEKELRQSNKGKKAEEEQFSDDEEDEESEEDGNETNENSPTVAIEDSEEKMDEGEESNKDPELDTNEQLKNADKSLKKLKKSKVVVPTKPISNGRTWEVNRAASTLGKRKLSFGKAAVVPSGKFRKSGGYFRKKLRTQMSHEFSA